MSFTPKVGIVSCSGEDCFGGGVSRMATLEVLHRLRPTDTVTICLPLFLAGSGGEREFAKSFPTITVDGCAKMCAAKGTAKYSSEPAVRINVSDYMDDPCSKVDGVAKAGEVSVVVRRVASDIASHVDRLRSQWR
ncbi:MAG: hypothetical protein C4K49_01895 [Candidatus Thorarchaeota archaeon]|nr:MAG: hypothetical protein C4K49_01895 [Candidatus Thorarchaeota archaeon]